MSIKEMKVKNKKAEKSQKPDDGKLYFSSS
jgi:hypothetical protein